MHRHVSSQLFFFFQFVFFFLASRLLKGIYTFVNWADGPLSDSEKLHASSSRIVRPLIQILCFSHYFDKLTIEFQKAMEDEYSRLNYGASCCSCRFFSSSLYFAVLCKPSLLHLSFLRKPYTNTRFCSCSQRQRRCPQTSYRCSGQLSEKKTQKISSPEFEQVRISLLRPIRIHPDSIASFYRICTLVRKGFDLH